MSRSASRTVVGRPACASMIAAVRPFGPEPMTCAVRQEFRLMGILREPPLPFQQVAKGANLQRHRREIDRDELPLPPFPALGALGRTCEFVLVQLRPYVTWRLIREWVGLQESQ